MTPLRLAILISGRGSNMAALSRAVSSGELRGLCRIAAVISNEPNAAGIELARDLGHPTVVVPSAGLDTVSYGARLLNALAAIRPDWIALAGFMRIISPEIVARYQDRIVNIHPADTRAYQGPDGYGWAHQAGLDKTWITVHRVDNGIDTGEILEQAEVDLGGAETLDEIRARGLIVEHSLYPRVLARLFTEVC